jgi:hypothetical protein
VSATKLIELRNTLERPLLVLLPPGIRTAAEDSLDIATFTELSLTGFAAGLVESLVRKLPATLMVAVVDALTYLRLERQWHNTDEVIEYLQTALKNGSDHAAAGGSLFVFGLLPDFKLFDRSNVRAWLSRNIKARDTLAEAAQPLQGRIQRLPIEPGSIQKTLFAFLRERLASNSREWTAQIACDAAFRSLSFDNWQFVDQIQENELRIILERLGLPTPPADEVSGAAALPVLDLDSAKGLKVAFRSSPPPAQVGAWKYFRVQLLSLEGGQPTIAWESNSYPKPAGKNRLITRTIKAGDLQSLEEGTYYLRVDGYDHEGALLTAEHKLNASDPNSRSENESEYFLVVRKGVEVEAPQSRAVPTDSFTDAWALASTRALAGRGGDGVPGRIGISGAWQEAIGAAPRADAHFALSGPGVTGYTVIVPGLLRKLEVEILSQPDRLGCFQISVADNRSLADAVVLLRQAEPLPAENGAFSAFLSTRKIVFEAIADQHVQRSSEPGEPKMRRGIVEVADLLALETPIVNYARAYARAVDATVTREDGAGSIARSLAQLDAVEIRWRRSPGDPGRALLVAPTHPLRLLWHLQHAAACERALAGWRDHTLACANWRGFMEQLRSELLPANLPMVLFDRRGRAYVETAPLTSHWSLYLPDRTGDDATMDVASSRDTARRLLGVRARGSRRGAIGAQELAGRAFEYLQQHPYAEQLRLNVFNPGDGELIADALRELEFLRQKVRGPDGESPSLRYCVQLFGAGEHLDLLGSALESLLDPERQVGEDDEFTLTSTNHLLPKLVFSRNSVDDFLRSPARYGAHVSVFLEQFAAHGRLANVQQLRRGSYVEGLVQEPETSLESTGSLFGWYKGLRPGTRPHSGEVEQLLGQLVVSAQTVQAAGATGGNSAAEIAPVVALHLDSSAQALVTKVHEVSDWVLTVDRNLGIEYFDSPASARESGYLLDFAPEYLQEDRQRIMLTTRSTLELEGLVRPALERFGLVLSQGDEIAIVEALRSLSGRLALRLLASPNHTAEVVGLLLARWLLEYSEVLQDHIVVPLDAHRGWFAEIPEDVEVEAGARRRADLLLVGFDAENRVLDVLVVEVKLREALTPAGRANLYRDMREQGERTEQRLRERFDLELFPLPRADALLRSKELATVLAFYVRRGHRYGLIGSEQTTAALDFVQNLDAGYHVKVRIMGVVFERQASGGHLDEEEPGFPVHRFGLDIAQKLLDATRDLRVGETEVVDRATPPAPEVVKRSFRERAYWRDSLDSFRSAVDSKRSRRSTTRPDATPPQSREGAEIAWLPDESNRAQQGEHLPGVESATREEASGFRQAVDSAEPSVTTRPEQDGSADAASADQPLNVVGFESSMIPRTPTVMQASNASPPAVAAGPGAEVTESSWVPGILVGASELTPQYGLLGKSGAETVAVDLTGCNTISLFGVQGFGKSYTMGVIAEMATTAVHRINVLPAPLATVIFHYHKSDAYAPEYASAIEGNQKPREIERLYTEYGAKPAGLHDLLLLTPEAKVEERRNQFPGLEIRAIKFASNELGAESWKFLLGAYDNDSLYVRQLVAIMRRYRQGLTLADFQREIAAADFVPSTRRLAEDRLGLAAPYIDDTASLRELLRPGRTIIVDLRDEWIEKDEALGLFVVMLRIFASSRHNGREFNKLVVFDEAHKYITESDLIGQVVETIREMRHQATSVLIASQDPLSVPRAVIELTSILLLHRITSPQWLRHLKSAISALDSVAEGHVASLQPGEALLWAQRSTDRRFSQRPQKITIRPRFTQHGGGTKTAVSGTTVR